MNSRKPPLSQAFFHLRCTSTSLFLENLMNFIFPFSNYPQRKAKYNHYTDELHLSLNLAANFLRPYEISSSSTPGPSATAISNPKCLRNRYLPSPSFSDKQSLICLLHNAVYTRHSFLFFVHSPLDGAPVTSP